MHRKPHFEPWRSSRNLMGHMPVQLEALVQFLCWPRFVKMWNFHVITWYWAPFFSSMAAIHFRRLVSHVSLQGRILRSCFLTSLFLVDGSLLNSIRVCFVLASTPVRQRTHSWTGLIVAASRSGRRCMASVMGIWTDTDFVFVFLDSRWRYLLHAGGLALVVFEKYLQ